MLNLSALWEVLDYTKKQELQKKIFAGGIMYEGLNKIRTAELSPSFALIESLAIEKGNNATNRVTARNKVIPELIKMYRLFGETTLRLYASA